MEARREVKSLTALSSGGSETRLLTLADSQQLPHRLGLMCSDSPASWTTSSPTWLHVPSWAKSPCPATQGQWAVQVVCVSSARTLFPCQHFQSSLRSVTALCLTRFSTSLCRQPLGDCLSTHRGHEVRPPSKLSQGSQFRGWAWNCACMTASSPWALGAVLPPQALPCSPVLTIGPPCSLQAGSEGHSQHHPAGGT
jgi:hypothetical protein